MKIATAPTLPMLRAAAPQPPQKPEPTPPSGDRVEMHFGKIAGTAAATGALGAAVGLGTSLLYARMDLGSATLAHTGVILAGGAAGTVVLGQLLQPKIEPPASYALGALGGAGLVWGTSALGIMARPGLGAVAGGLLGALYGGLGAMMAG